MTQAARVAKNAPVVPAATLQIAAMLTPAIARVIQRPAFMPATKSTTNMITTILLDGKPLGFGGAPLVEDGRAMIFLRPLITAIGGSLRWDGEAKQATATLDQHSVVFTVGQNTAMVDGQQTHIDRKVAALNGHLVIPATAWHDIYAGAVGYDEEYSCVWLRSHASLVRAKLAE